MPQRELSHSTQQYHPPADREIDKYAETVCIKLSETKACFNYNPETAKGLAKFLKIAGKIETSYLNNGKE